MSHRHVTLRAASGATIRFRTQNGETVDGVPARELSLPHLVLHRNGALTAPPERTLIVEVESVAVPVGGVVITLEITTQHADPDRMGAHGEPILVWRETRHVSSADGSVQTRTTVVFTHTFTARVMIDTGEVPMPTDYFRYRISIASAEHGGAVLLHQLEGDYAFLMEDQWLVPLPKVREASDGAAPHELLVYYCDMFPFRKGPTDKGHGDSRLLRSEVAGTIRAGLVPAMVEAFRAQSDIWGFYWHDAWTSYRGGGDSERLSVALTDGQTWFHGSAPDTGHSAISLNTNASDETVPYDALTDALVSTFHHELFHNLQRSISQGLGGDGRVDGAGYAWQFFSEGTAFLASSVGLPGAHFRHTGSVGRHVASARLAQDVWNSRTLLGSCGALYSGDIVDITSSTDLVGGLPRVMYQAFAETPSCPFRTFEESLIQFARAIYALRLAGGRCVAPGLPTGCGFYDPHDLYAQPPVSELGYAGSELRFTDGIRNSYGMEYVDLNLYPDAQAQPLTIEIVGVHGGHTRFSVQVWTLNDAGPERGPRPVPGLAAGPEVLGTMGPGGRLVYTIPSVDLTEFNRIGLIITRVDANEGSDPVGEYTIRLGPG